MRIHTKEQVIDEMSNLMPCSHICVIYGKGYTRQKDRPREYFDIRDPSWREDSLGRLAAFLSEKSLTNNISSISMPEWRWGIINISLRESKSATMNSNIDADMIQTILDCANEIGKYNDHGAEIMSEMEREMRMTGNSPFPDDCDPYADIDFGTL